MTLVQRTAPRRGRRPRVRRPREHARRRHRARRAAGAGPHRTASGIRGRSSRPARCYPLLAALSAATASPRSTPARTSRRNRSPRSGWCRSSPPCRSRRSSSSPRSSRRVDLPRGAVALHRGDHGDRSTSSRTARSRSTCRTASRSTRRRVTSARSRSYATFRGRRPSPPSATGRSGARPGRLPRRGHRPRAGDRARRPGRRRPPRPRKRERPIGRRGRRSAISARSRSAAAGACFSSAQTPGLNSAISRIGDVATTEAVRRPDARTATSPNTSPGPSVATLAPPALTSAVPLSIA